MKKILLAALTLTTLLSTGQILNPGFELVTSNKPDDWNQGFYSTYFIRDTTASYTGTKAAYIRAFGAQSYSVQGAVLGVFTASGKPLALEGWYKCNLQPGDSLVFSPYVYQTTVQSPAAQAYSYAITSSSVYKQFSAPFNYSAFPGNSIGTVYISIYLSGPTLDAENVAIPQAGTWAIIDELTLSTPVATAIQKNESAARIEKLYPQPAAGYCNLVYNLSSTTSCTLKVFDVTGKSVKTVLENEKQTPGRYKAEIDLNSLSPGIYMAQLSTSEGTYVSKLIKE